MFPLLLLVTRRPALVCSPATVADPHYPPPKWDHQCFRNNSSNRIAVISDRRHPKRSIWIYEKSCCGNPRNTWILWVIHNISNTICHIKNKTIHIFNWTLQRINKEAWKMFDILSGFRKYIMFVTYVSVHTISKIYMNYSGNLWW